MIKSKEITYPLSDSLMAKGFMAYDDSKETHEHAVMVVHDWGGRSEFYCQKAIELAKLGYVGFSVDMYGDALVAKDREDKVSLLAPFKEDRQKVITHMQAAYECLLNQHEGKISKVAAFGYCFGGMCVLDLARSGALIQGAVSFHGILKGLPFSIEKPITSQVLVLHGYEDSFVSPEQLLEFSDEMTKKGVDWQLHIYGQTHHSFSLPGANDPELGLHYDKKADKRSWDAACYFLNEIFI